MKYNKISFVTIFLVFFVIISCTQSDAIDNEENEKYSGEYTKFSANGDILEIQDGVYDNENGTTENGTKWDCVRTNYNAKIWTVHNTDQDSLLNSEVEFTWYSTSNNEGDAGNQIASCDSSNCDTTGFVNWANNNSLCGVTDWHLPSLEELQMIVAYNNSSEIYPSINSYLFPNTSHGFYWSSNSSESPSNNKANGILFSQGGLIGLDNKSSANSVRLVGTIDADMLNTE